MNNETWAINQARRKLFVKYSYALFALFPTFTFFGAFKILLFYF